MDLKDAAIRQADERAAREGKRMWVYHVERDAYGRDNAWYVRSYDEGVPYGRNVTTIYSTPSTEEEL
jgi:hypothetical protein